MAKEGDAFEVLRHDYRHPSDGLRTGVDNMLELVGGGQPVPLLNSESDPERLQRLLNIDTVLGAPLFIVAEGLFDGDLDNRRFLEVFSSCFISIPF